MGTSDLISIAAFLVGLWSLYVARNALNATNRAKGIEHRAEMLMVLVTMRDSNRRCLAMWPELAAMAATTKNAQIIQRTEDMRAAALGVSDSLDNAQATLLALQPKDGLDAYASIRHTIEDLRMQQDATLEGFSKSKSQLVVLNDAILELEAKARNSTKLPPDLS